MRIFTRADLCADRALLLDLLSAHTAMISAARSLDESLTQLVGGACKLARIPLGYGRLCVLDPATGRIQQDVQADGRHSRVHDSVVVPRGVTGRAIRERETLLVLDPTRDPEYIALHPDVRAELVIPLLQGDVCWGALNLASPDRKRFTPELVALLEMLAQQAVLTIQYDAYRRHEASHQLRGDVRQASGELARAALRALPEARATVEVQLLSDDGEDLITIASATESALPTIPGSFGKGSTLAWRAVLTRAPVRRSHLALDDPRTSLQTTFAALVLPLRGRDGAVRGVLNVEAPEHSRLNDDQALAEAEVLLAGYVDQAEAILDAADEQTLAQVMSIDTILSEIGRAIDRLTPESNLEQFYAQVARSVAQRLGGSDVSAAILLVERDRQTGEEWLVLVPGRTYRYEGALEQSQLWRISEGRVGRAARTGMSQRARDVLDPHEAPEYPAPEYATTHPATRSELDVPIVRSGRVLGVMHVTSPNVGVFGEDHEHKVEVLAQQVAAALDRMEQFRQGQIAEEHLSLIGSTNAKIEGMLENSKQQGIVQAIALRGRRAEILQELLQSALGTSGASFGAVLLAVEVPIGPSRRPDSSGKEIEREFACLATWPPATPVEVPVEGGTAQLLYQRLAQPRTHERHLVLRDLALLDPAHRPVALTAGARSAVALPINNGSGVIGVLCLEHPTPLTYGPEQLDWLDLLTSQMANVISTADLHLHRLQQQRLINLGIRLVRASAYPGSRDPLDPAMQERVLRAALQLTEQEDGYAELWLAHGQTLRIHSFIRDDVFRHGPEYTQAYTSAGIITRVYESKRPVLALDVRSPQWAGIYTESWERTRSELAVPLLDSSIVGELADADAVIGIGQVIGVINVESRYALGFGNRDVDILELLAQTTVTAIKNRELYRARMDLLRDVTHALAKALYPLRVPAFALRDAVLEAGSNQVPLAERRSDILDVATLSDLANNLVKWFQDLVLGEQQPGTVPMRPTPLVTLVETMTERMEPMATRSAGGHKRIVYDVPEGDEVMVECSDGLIRAALFLLVENALQYSPPGDTVLIRLLRLPGETVEIEVADHGAPVPPEEREEIFGRGVRGQAGLATLSVDGTIEGGIGLDHVRRIAEDIHHGQAGYVDRAGESIFFIRLPLQQQVR